jgi:hypothetical protein
MHFITVIFTFLSFSVLALPAEEKADIASSDGIESKDDLGDKNQTYDLNAETVDMMASCPRWIIRGLRRHCNKHDTRCDWSFGIDEGHGHVTPCSFSVHSPHHKRGSDDGTAEQHDVDQTGHHHGASRTDSQGHRCGKFTIASGWSGQFGPGHGFTVLSVIDKHHQLIVWPGYTDKQLEHDQVVCPDQSYAPAKLPA